MVGHSLRSRLYICKVIIIIFDCMLFFVLCLVHTKCLSENMKSKGTNDVKVVSISTALAPLSVKSVRSC